MQSLLLIDDPVAKVNLESDRNVLVYSSEQCPSIYPFVSEFKHEGAKKWPSLAWDAGIVMEIPYNSRTIDVVGPALASYSHALARLIKEFPDNWGEVDFERMVVTHLTQLTTDFDVVAINMPRLGKNGGSLTKGIFIDSFRPYIYQYDMEYCGSRTPYDIYIFKGKLNTIEFKDFVKNPKTVRGIVIMAQAWETNFKDHIKNFPVEHDELNAAWLTAIGRHIISAVRSQDK